MSYRFSEEKIPNTSNVYHRVLRKSQILDDEPAPIVFHNSKTTNSFSADWDKYSTPQDTQKNHQAKYYKTEDFAVISMNVGNIREIKNQDVLHTPYIEQAHCSVEGEKNEEIIFEFIEISSWEIK